MSAVYNNRALSHRTLRTVARLTNKQKLTPSDLNAPAPQQEALPPVPYDHAITLVVSALATLDDEPAHLLRQMARDGWIDARATPNRSTGAYCYSFSNPIEPRIFSRYGNHDLRDASSKALWH